jgi:DNA-directed RNA polymerase sigma subunit (sigma70/sigma32)
MTYREIAEILGVSQQTVRTIEQAALRKLAFYGGFDLKTYLEV